jgi:hypothetical protein
LPKIEWTRLKRQMKLSRTIEREEGPRREGT